MDRPGNHKQKGSNIKLLFSITFRAWGFFIAILLAAAPRADGAETVATPSPFGEVKHSPKQPRSGEPVAITLRYSGDAASLAVEYQVVEPGQYIALNDSDYKSQWQTIPMVKQSANSEDRFVARIPGSSQVHRRLVRYRIKAADASGRATFAPPADDPEPNWAYFVYDGIPPWQGAIQPKSGDAVLGKTQSFGTNVMAQAQNYFLIASAKDVENATWRRQNQGKEYNYTGTFVADGAVYDHVRFRARGGVWRHAMGKNMWKFDFNKGHKFQAVDDYGRKYGSKWAKVNLRACIQQGDYGRRGEQGMYEAVGFRLFNLCGVEAPRTHWISLRIVDEKAENPPDQYHGDFWGLYLAIENEDGHFLAEHGLPDGNVYKMMYGQGELSHQGANQPTNQTDIREFLGGIQRAAPDAWWRRNVDLERYFSYRTVLEGIHHYDISDGKNYDFYRNPTTGRWSVIPWDIDLTWGDHMYGGGYEPFYTILSRPAFRIEYQNRAREIRDLLFNPGETGRLIDECAALISNSDGPGIVDADRAKWDYHPVMASNYSMRGKADQGLFYRASPTEDFAGMVRQMKDYVRHRAQYIDRLIGGDAGIPAKPLLTYAGQPGFPANGLRFKSSAFAGGSQFAAMKWRLGEIDPPSRPKGKPAQQGRYEITAVWESPEVKEFKDQIALPAGTAKPGHTYRARVRMKDASGRWSHWSDPVEFTAGAE